MGLRHAGYALIKSGLPPDFEHTRFKRVCDVALASLPYQKPCSSSSKTNEVAFLILFLFQSAGVFG
jgi:hypothetical protein